MTSTLQPPRAPRASAPPPARKPSGVFPGLHRRHVGIVIGLLVGAGAMLALATLDEVAGTRVPVLSRLATAPVGEAPRVIPARTPPPPTPGTCLTWERPDAADAEAVDCGRSHLFEQAGAVQLADFAVGAALPDNQRFRQLVNERCTPLVIRYLGGRYDPNGAFRAGALKPSQKRWSEGDRSLRCGLQRFSRSGALYPIVGKVGAQDQADVRAAGTCLGIDGRFIGDPVDCALPHAVESVGWIDLGAKFKGKFPAVGDQDAFLQPACFKLASDYAGGDKVIGDRKLSVLWDNLTQESWNVGTRKVACNLAAQLPDKSGFAPVTGTVRGPVQVGDRAAPPARVTAVPGAPAPAEPLSGAATEPGPPQEGGPDGLAPADDQPLAPGPAPVERPPAPAPPSDPPRPPKVKLPDDKLPELPDLGGGRGRDKPANPLGGGARPANPLGG